MRSRDSLPAKDRERLEDPGRPMSPGDRDPDRLEELARLDSGSSTTPVERLLDLPGLEVLDPLQRLDGGARAAGSAPSFITFFQAFSSSAGSSKQEADQRPDLGQRLGLLLGDLAGRPQLLVGLAAEVNAATSRVYSSSGISRMKRPLIQRSFCSSKIADELPTSSSVEALDQLLGRHQRRVVVGPPAEQREVVADRRRQVALRRAAPGPRRRRGAWRASCRRARAAAAGARSGAGSSPRASITSSCFGVLERWSSPADDVGDPHLDVVDGDREVVEDRSIPRAMTKSSSDAGWGTGPRPGSGPRRPCRPRRGPAAAPRALAFAAVPR